MSILLGSLSTVAALLSAVGAILAWKISKRAFDWQKRRGAPEVRVSVRTDPQSPTIIFLVIENSGGTIAYDIAFELSEQIPARAFVIDAKAAAAEAFEQMSDGPLFSGIPALAPGDQRVIMWGQYGGIHSWLGDGFVRVWARFKDSAGVPSETLSVLEVKSFELTDASGDDPHRRSARALEKIAQTIDWASTGIRPWLIETPDNRVVRQRRQYELVRQKQQQKAE